MLFAKLKALLRKAAERTVDGLWKAIGKLKSDMDLVIFNLPAEFDEIAPAAARAPFALFSLALVVTFMVTGRDGMGARPRSLPFPGLVSHKTRRTL